MLHFLAIRIAKSTVNIRDLALFVICVVFYEYI